MVSKIGPNAFREWITCTRNLNGTEVRSRLNKLRAKFRTLPGSVDLVSRSGCPGHQIMAIFSTESSARQARRAIACVSKAFEKPADSFPTTARFNEECEREKRNMINRARNLLIAAVAVTTASGVCCAAVITSAAWCPIFAAAIAAEAAAIAELVSARQFECPECSSAARVLSISSKVQFDKRFLIAGVSDTSKRFEGNL